MSSTEDKLQGVKKCIEEAEKAHKPFALEWQRLYDVYLGEPEKEPRKKAAWRNKHRVKHAFQQVETLLPEFLVDDPGFEVVGRERTDEERARVVQRLLTYQLDRDRYDLKRMEAVKKAIIFGMCPVKVTWSYEVRRQKVRNPMPPEERAQALLRGETVEPYIEQDVTHSDDPTMVVVDPFDFMWEPGATSIDDAAYVLHRSWQTDGELRAKEKAGIYTGIGEMLDGDGSKGGGGLFGSIGRRLSTETSDESEAKRGDKNEVIEKWTKDGRLLVVVNRARIVRDVENPYWHGRIPFVIVTTQPSVDKLPGLSEVWSIEDLQRAAHEIHNKSYDALDLILDPVIFFQERDSRMGDFEFRPGARGFVPDPRNAVNVVDLGQASAYASGSEVQNIVGMMERTTGINASVAGTSNESTATEAAMNLRQGKSRIALKISNVDRAFARAAEMFIQLDQQFIDADRVVRIVGDDAQWESLTPQDIAGAFDVKARNSSERAVKELAREQSLNLLNTFAQYAGMGVNVWPLLERAARDHDIDPALLYPNQQAGGGAPTPGLDGTQPAQEQAAMEQAQIAGPDGLDANGFAPDALTGQ